MRRPAQAKGQLKQKGKTYNNDSKQSFHKKLSIKNYEDMRETSTEKFNANATEKANPASAPPTSKEKASPSFFKGRRRKGTLRFLETS
ncbi:hypothetical protein OAQ57_02420, partial [Candidatus Marinimicrobia bacterium]|nr:hypothetical protein [Candidatus Neomarinimicrobiota bacterium]